MKYIKLIDYLDKPELIQHVDGREVKDLRHFKENHPWISVLFKNGQTNVYTADGRFTDSELPSFVLRETVESWDNESKYMCTKTGRDARIYCTDGGGAFPIHGAVRTNDGDWSFRQWNLKGETSPGFHTSDNLKIEYETKIRKKTINELVKDGWEVVLSNALISIIRNGVTVNCTLSSYINGSLDELHSQFKTKEQGNQLPIRVTRS